jgi:hypothetical protein
MTRLLLASLGMLSACGGVKVVRTPEYRKIDGLPADLAIVLSGDATYEWNETARKRGRDAVGSTLCPALVHYFRATDTFGLVACSVLPAPNVGPERDLAEGFALHLPADGQRFTPDRRAPELILFVEDLKILSALSPEERKEKGDATTFKHSFTTFGGFAWWDNRAGGLIAWGQFPGEELRAGLQRGDPLWDDAAWTLARWMGDGMPFEFTW